MACIISDFVTEGDKSRCIVRYSVIWPRDVVKLLNHSTVITLITQIKEKLRLKMRVTGFNYFMCLTKELWIFFNCSLLLHVKIRQNTKKEKGQPDSSRLECRLPN